MNCYDNVPDRALELLVDNNGVELLKEFVDGDLFLISNQKDVFYRYRKGILVHRSVSDLDTLMESEAEERDRQSSLYDKRLNKRIFNEIIPTNKIIDTNSKGVVVEYGCGTGRFTDHIARKADVVFAIDFSFESLLILKTKLEKEGIKNVVLIQADVTKIKFKSLSVSTSYAFQVYEHIPNLWQRQEWLLNINDSLVEKGKVIMTVYHHDLLRRLKKQSESGLHSGKIFYRFYNSLMLRCEWYGIFENIHISYMDLRIPGAVRFNLCGKLIGLLSKIGARIPVVRKLAHLVVVYADKSDNVLVGVNSIGYLYPGKFKLQFISWFGCLEGGKDVSRSHFSYEKATVDNCKIKGGVTSVINLDKSEDKLWEACRKKFIRQQINKGRRNGITIKRLYESSELDRLSRDFRKSKNLSSSSSEVFSLGTMYGAYYQDSLIAGGVFFENRDYTRAYTLISSRLKNKVMREIIGQANRMLIWEAMLDAKSRGIKYLDLGGLNDPADSLTEFKESFGGERMNQFYIVCNRRKNFLDPLIIWSYRIGKFV